MMVMMQAGEVTEVGGSFVQGDRAPLVLRDGGNIVIESHESELPDVKEEGGHVGLSKNPSLLQVTVCQVTGGIVSGYNVALDVLRENSMPHGRGFSRCEEDSPMPCLAASTEPITEG